MSAGRRSARCSRCSPETPTTIRWPATPSARKDAIPSIPVASQGVPCPALWPIGRRGDRFLVGQCWQARRKRRNRGRAEAGDRVTPTMGWTQRDRVDRDPPYACWLSTKVGRGPLGGDAKRDISWFTGQPYSCLNQGNGIYAS